MKVSGLQVQHTISDVYTSDRMGELIKDVAHWDELISSTLSINQWPVPVMLQRVTQQFEMPHPKNSAMVSVYSY